MAWTWPAIRLTDGTLEALKWLGLVCMTCDHVNKYLFNETLPYLYEIGRLTMPIFGIVLAVNLARPRARERGIYARTMVRLVIFGAIATVPFLALGGVVHHWWPLNILFMLLGVVAIVELAHRGTWWSITLAMMILVVGGSSVEFWWPAMFFCVAVWWYASTPGWPAAAVAIWSLACLVLVNGTWWALAALPMVCLMAWISPRVPRLRWVFYGYYPLHLAALWLIRIPMRHAGYLFFT